MRTKRYDVFVTVAASYDLEDIEEWLERHEPDGRAGSVVDDLLYCFDGLARMPTRGSIVPEIDHLIAAEYREVIHTGYRIIYRIDTTQVFVIAVVHQRRDVKSVMMARALRL
jgi:toxin ParE1/3/4